MAGVYVVIAVLPFLLLLGAQAGVVPQEYAVFFGANSLLPPLFPGGAEVNPLVWAWGIFFSVLALIVASDPGAGARPRAKPKGDSEEGVSRGSIYAAQEPQYVRAIEPPKPEPRVVEGANLPAVDAPAKAAAAFGAASRLNGLHRHEEVLRGFERATELDPRSVAAWYGKAESLCVLDRHEEAIASFNEALMLDRGNARLWHGKGKALAKLGRQPEATECFGKARELDPSYQWAQ